MDDPASASHFQSDKLGLRHMSSSIFNISGFFVGFGPKGTLDSDCLRSPTSPLDFSFFSNLGNPFSFTSSKLLSQSVYQKKWKCSEVGLGIKDLLSDETKPTGGVLDSPPRKNIIFGPQVKTGNSPRSSSLPRNYIISQLSPHKTPFLCLGKSFSARGNDGGPLDHKLFQVFSPIFLTPKSNLSPKKSCPKDVLSTTTRAPLITGGSSQMESSSITNPCSLQIPFASSQGCIGSLSANEIELSEDYTCVISHGPNPKTTHIFGDYILECHPTELSSFDKIGNLEIELPQIAKGLEECSPYQSNDFLSFCYSCKRKLDVEDDSLMYRGEKTFFCFDCRSLDLFAEEEMSKTEEDSNKSPESSYDGDLFLMGMPIAT